MIQNTGSPDFAARRKEASGEGRKCARAREATSAPAPNSNRTGTGLIEAAPRLGPQGREKEARLRDLSKSFQSKEGIGNMSKGLKIGSKRHWQLETKTKSEIQTTKLLHDLGISIYNSSRIF